MIETTIDGFSIGDTVDIQRTFTVQSGFVATDAYFAVRQYATQSGALIEKHITTQESDHGLLEPTILTFYLTEQDTNVFNAFSTYVYGIQVVQSGTRTLQTTTERGTLTVYPKIAR